MTSAIKLAEGVELDFARIAKHLAAHKVPDLPERIESIRLAIDVLAQSPQIGRPVRRGLRELVIGKAERGYLALYRYQPIEDVVLILAVRHQRERGYRKN